MFHTEGLLQDHLPSWSAMTAGPGSKVKQIPKSLIWSRDPSEWNTALNHTHTHHHHHPQLCNYMHLICNQNQSRSSLLLRICHFLSNLTRFSVVDVVLLHLWSLLNQVSGHSRPANMSPELHGRTSDSSSSQRRKTPRFSQEMTGGELGAASQNTPRKVRKKVYKRNRKQDEQIGKS